MRAIFLVVFTVSAVAALSCLNSYRSTVDSARSDALAAVGDLIDTVEPSASIASFLGDSVIASEVTRGLLFNPIIAYARVEDLEGQVLSDSTREGLYRESTPLVVDRVISHPYFDDTVGFVHVEIDRSILEATITDKLVPMFLPLAIQTVVTVLALVAGISLVFWPKTRALMEQIDSVQPHLGESLTVPRSETHSELGVLTSYINRLIARMYELLETERELRAEQQIQKLKLRAILENTKTGIFLVDDMGSIRSFNPAFGELGLIEEQDAVALIEGSLEKTSSIPISIHRELIQRIAGPLPASFEYQHRLPDSQALRWLQINLASVGKGLVQGVVNDITDVKLQQIRAHSDAITDELTGLGNRRGLRERLEHELEHIALGEHSSTVLLLDLDLFKAVNDTFGHEAGDEVLIAVARRLGRIVTADDYIARLGGDEFTVLLKNCDRPRAQTVSEQIIENLNRPVSLGKEKAAKIGVSIGGTILPAGATARSSAVLRIADDHLYMAKEAGKNTFRLATTESGTSVQAALSAG